jgi:hypothetical protein
MRQATAQEFQFVQEVLREFAPWTNKHPDCCPPSASLLESYLFPDSQVTEAERIHALIDPECTGWVRFVDEFNAHPSTAMDLRLPDPREQLRVPDYAGGGSGLGPPENDEANRSSVEDRFNPEPLTSIELISLKRGVM